MDLSVHLHQRAIVLSVTSQNGTTQTHREYYLIRSAWDDSLGRRVAFLGVRKSLLQAVLLPNS